MPAAIARVLIALVAGVLLAVAIWALVNAFELLTLEGDEGGATVFGLFMLPSAVVIALIGVGLFALAIRQ